MIILSQKNNEANIEMVNQEFQPGAEVHYCFLMVAKFDTKDVQEKAWRAIEESPHNNSIFDWKKGMIGVKKDGEIMHISPKDIGFVRYKKKAAAIIMKLAQYLHLIDNGSKPKDICKPFRAALDAKVIEKPKPKELKLLFGDNFVGKSSFNKYCNQVDNPYKGDKLYTEMKNTFARYAPKKKSSKRG